MTGASVVGSKFALGGAASCATDSGCSEAPFSLMTSTVVTDPGANDGGALRPQVMTLESSQVPPLGVPGSSSTPGLSGTGPALAYGQVPVVPSSAESGTTVVLAALLGANTVTLATAMLGSPAAADPGKANVAIRRADANANRRPGMIPGRRLAVRRV